MEEKVNKEKSELDHVKISDENYYKISNCDSMRPFFMSIVSNSNHWMFISSNGGLTAGRKNAEHALFPYYTDDKITESAEITGSKSVFIVRKQGKSDLWEPFSYRNESRYKVSRNLYKNVLANKVIFEEVNHDLGLIFRYQWNSSDRYGFVRKATLINNTQGQVTVSILDGIQNIIPHGVGSDLQNAASNLVDAYKRSELDEKSGLAIYALSAIIADKAEPSEALKANIAWSIGLNNPKYLLSSLQLNKFRKENPIRQETDIKAEKGAYFINAEIVLSSKTEKEWMIIANVNQTHAAIARITSLINNGENIDQQVNDDIELGSQRLIQLNAASDGLQRTADRLRDSRHYSNVLFNIMRGGIFDHNYQIEKWDFSHYLSKANKEVFRTAESTMAALPEVFSLFELKKIANGSKNKDFARLCLEYMPLKFSRRHGDPSRPWNKFSINTQSEIDGSKVLDYEGNWRDIFQNWEALVHSYPEFIESMLHKFLNATTFDGYNPYRVTKDGFDWETIEPDNPWSYIGYWGDHQIIYLLKFLEFTENHAPGTLESYFDQDIFVYANLPYKIKSYTDILKNPKDTIDFDFDSDHKIRLNREENGADGALLREENKAIYKVNFVEKMLATILAKLSNFVSEGGIWMNTQRPEWNDANNALVGNGVSMVTLYYLRRFLMFLKGLLAASKKEGFKVSNELVDCYKRIRETFETNQYLLSDRMLKTDRKLMLDSLGQAGSDYRQYIYKRSFWGKKRTISMNGLMRFVDLSLEFLEHSIQANKRQDHLYHAYNLLTVENENEISISYLNEMLEGQVAVLSSGYLSFPEALAVLDSLRSSKLFREDQYSYLLYPNKDLPRFNEKNNIPKEAVNESALLRELIRKGNVQIIEKDVYDRYHFNGNFKNANDLKNALAILSKTEGHQFVEKEQELVLQIFEQVFNHKSFTGRSGTFYGYEGLGSIYWHMVSKLQLAVMECCVKAIEQKESDEIVGRLLEHYYEINEGIGVHKSPSLYGAFPTDPYSHTPAGKGAQQPGMTGQVKEDILSRFGELGVFVKNSKLNFNPCLLRKEEFLTEASIFEYVDVHKKEEQIELEEGSLCFTYCQVPIIYKLANTNKLTVVNKKNDFTEFETLSLDTIYSKQVFRRTGEIIRILVHLNAQDLR